MSHPQPESLNDWIDLWRNEIGVNIIPADTKNKRPIVEWKQYQDVPISEDQHKQWKSGNFFSKGIALIPGKIWHNEHKRGLYLGFVDLDNKKAIEEFCTRDGVITPLNELAKRIIIEQHADEPNKAHAYFYSTKPLLKKGSDRISDLLGKIDKNEIPAIEVKGLGEHGIAYCTPSPHKNGYYYRIIGTVEPQIINGFQEHLDSICRKYNIPYLDSNGNGNGKSRISIQDYFNGGAKVYEGHNRHEALLRVMESLIRRNQNILNDNNIKRLAAEWNQQHCVPPLIEREFEDQWIDAIKYIMKVSIKQEAFKKTKTNDTKGEDSDLQSTKAELVLQKAKEKCNKLFVDEYQTAHADISVGGHLEVLPLSSRRFRNWISGVVYKEEGVVVDHSTLKDAIGILSAQAEFDSGDPIKLNLRVASLEDNSKLTWYYDLTNKPWEFIEITSSGWKVANNIVLFRRFNQLPQVYPSRDYPPDIFDRFLKLLNLKVKEETTEEFRLLLKCYIISLFVPDIAKAVLMPHGHQGSAKTTLVEFIKMLVDPSIVRTLSFPRDMNELIQQLSHNYLAFYDNISELPDWISDQICRAVTGSGSSKRLLYTDDEDFIRSLKRCIALNGINLAATKPDLLDRSITLELKRIADQDRRKLADLEKEFELIRPQLLGYILDILAKVLKWKEEGRDLELAKLPRMADFGECCEVISRCMGNRENAFLEAYDQNIKIQIEEIIESSQIAQCVRGLITAEENKLSEWSGTATELLTDLENIALELKINIKGRYWPKAPNQLSKKLNVVAPSMRDAGIEIKWIRNNGKSRTINICKVSSSSSQDENQIQIIPQNCDDTLSNGQSSSQTSSQNNNHNLAQSENFNDSDDNDDTLRQERDGLYCHLLHLK